jgi:putative endopeptidase
MVKIQDDLYNSINKKWSDKIKIPAAYSKWGVFEELYENSLKQLNKLLKNLNESNHEEKVISILNMQYLEKNNKSADPFTFYSNLINYTFLKKELIAKMCFLTKYNIGTLLSIHVIPDFKNSEYNILAITPGLLLLPDRDYYLKEDKKHYVDKLQVFIKSLLKLINLEVNADEISKKMIDIQKRIAKIKMSKEEARNPEKIYNIYTFSKLKKEFKNFDWDVFFSSLNIKPKEILIEDKKYLKEFIKIFEEEDIEVLRLYLLIKFILSVSDTLDESIEDIIFDFYGKYLSGKKKKKVKWKRCIEFVNGEAGEILGKLYVKKYFPNKCKKKMEDITKKLIISYRKRIKNLSWMDESTKKKALRKLNKMNVKIGYPDKFKNFNSLDISGNKSLLDNVLELRKFYYDYEISFLYKKPDPKEWEMNPHQINAYYHVLKNEIVFPAGILQPPFFKIDFKLPQIYGGIGAIIGHEITHGFDDQGRKFDENGNMNNWWSKNDMKEYNEMAKKIINQFNSFEINGKNVNGKLTQGENIADLGGLVISLEALKSDLGKKCKKEHIKLFFETWARIWRCKISKKEQEKRLMTDVHSPNYFRVNGPVVNIDDFHNIFNTKKSDKMYLEKKNRIKIW